MGVSVWAMTADPRAALSTLVSAFERHLEAAASRRNENDPAVVAAYQALADAFEEYDDALLDAYGEVTPLEVYAGEDDEDVDDDDAEDEDGDDFDDEDDDETYVGMGDDDVDYEDSRN